jgi:ComF family protein
MSRASILIKLKTLLFPLSPHKARVLNKLYKLSADPKIIKLNNTEISALFSYKESVLRKSIWLLKYKGIDEVVDFFAQNLSDYFLEDISDEISWQNKEIIFIPVPLHSKKEKQRGFNHMKLVLRKLKTKLGDLSIDLKIDSNIITRVKNTRPQMYLSKKERRENLKGAFSVQKEVNNSIIIVVDDIITSGSTLLEMKKTLKKVGKNNKIILVALSYA